MAGSVATQEFGKFVRRIVRAYGRRVGDSDEPELAEMVKLCEEVRQETALAIARYLAYDEGTPKNLRTRTWTTLAREMGVSKQSVRQTWTKRVETARVTLTTK